MEDELKERVVFDELRHTGDGAWLLRFDTEETWVPMSQCTLDEDEHVVEMPMWLIKKKGLESYIE